MMHRCAQHQNDAGWYRLSCAAQQHLHARKHAAQEAAVRVQADISGLAEFLGEKPDADPAALFGLIWEFAGAFDEAYAGIAAADVAS